MEEIIMPLSNINYSIYYQLFLLQRAVDGIERFSKIGNEKNMGEYSRGFTTIAEKIEEASIIG